MWPPVTVNAPFDPETVPAVVVPSPQAMVAAKLDDVSLVLVSVNCPEAQSPRSLRRG
jgi:hypothetical protein